MVKDISRKPLPIPYKEAALEKYSQSESLRNTYIEIGYLSAVQANWRQKTEADQLAAFCSFCDKSTVTKLIAKARPEAIATEAAAPVAEFKDVIDDDLLDV